VDHKNNKRDDIVMTSLVFFVWKSAFKKPPNFISIEIFSIITYIYNILFLER